MLKLLVSNILNLKNANFYSRKMKLVYSISFIYIHVADSLILLHFILIVCFAFETIFVTVKVKPPS